MSDSLQQLLINDVPLIDVRAPVEFSRGSFPLATNLPMLDDQQREQIGTCYKENGQAAAVSLGHQLVSGDLRDARISSWTRFIDQHPGAHLYCFRGGQRSGIACDWLAKSGYDVPRVPGGYKALRQLLLKVFDALPPLVIVSGKTGTGKTQFLKKFSQIIDLEGFANHRGSAFGRYIDPQPSQIDFENAVAIALLKHGCDTEVLVEDEGRLIGRIHVPLQLQEKMKSSPVVVIEESLEVRTGRIFDEYIVHQWHQYKDVYRNDALRSFSEYLTTAVDAIRKRLGGDRHQAIRKQVADALDAQVRGDMSLHRAWISSLLVDYYDPMYEYQLEQKQGRIQFRGPRDEVLEWYRTSRGLNPT